MERRFDMLLGGTHGCRPPERLEMCWTNTFFREDMELSRITQQQFNQQQLAAGQPEIPLYPYHAHSLLWPEKMTKDRLIRRNVVRHADPSLCILGSQSRLLFMRTHVLGQAFHERGKLPEGWHAGQVMCLDEVPSFKPTLVQHEHVMWTQHPRASMGSKALTEACKRVQRDVGTDIGSRAKQLRKDALLQGISCEGANALLYGKLSLQQQVYSNQNPEAMLASQGHPAFGQDKNFYAIGGGGGGGGGHSELPHADQALLPRQHVLL